MNTAPFTFLKRRFMNPVGSYFNESKTVWDKHFIKTQSIFANNLAKNIAKSLQNPDSSLFSREELELGRAVYLSLDLTQPTEITNKIVQLAGSHITLIPFRDWLEDSETPSFPLASEEKKYIQRRMDTIGRLVEKKCNEIFQKLASDPQNSHLKFEAVYIDGQETVQEMHDALEEARRPSLNAMRSSDMEKLLMQQSPILPMSCDQDHSLRIVLHKTELNHPARSLPSHNDLEEDIYGDPLIIQLDHGPDSEHDDCITDSNDVSTGSKLQSIQRRVDQRDDQRKEDFLCGFIVSMIAIVAMQIFLMSQSENHLSL
jgi:hypothetical protein